MLLIKKQLIAAVLAATISGSALAQAPAVPAVPAPPTLWSFLGIPQGVKKVQGALTNRRGNFPKTEPKDALKALNDPANLESPDAAIKKAAEIKKAEDLKPQKIKAIKYLTSIGCGCYDKDGSVTKALVAAAEDCTEEVRLETMTQINEAANGKCCSNCGQVCCCNEDMLKKLAQVAYERDEYGCYSEPSKRVRDAAAQALAACCPGAVPLEILAPEKKEEEPKEEKPEVTPVPEKEKPAEDRVPEKEGAGTESAPKAETDSISDEPERLPDADSGSNREPKNLIEPGKSPSDVDSDNITLKFSDQLKMRETYAPANRIQPRPMPQMPSNQGSSLQVTPSQSNAARAPRLQSASYQGSVPEGIVKMRQVMVANPPQTSASPNPQGGVVLAFDRSSNVAYVHFEQADIVVPAGTTLHLRPDPNLASGFNGMWQVVESTAGCANLHPIGTEGIARVRVGDHANFGTPDVVVAPISYVP